MQYYEESHLWGFDYEWYGQVNLAKPCPFWADDSRCALPDCSVAECKETELPEALRGKSRAPDKNKR